MAPITPVIAAGEATGRMVSFSMVLRAPETGFDTFEATKRLNAEDKTDLEKLAQPLDVADTTKKND